MVTGTNDFSGKHSVVDYIPIVSTIVALGNLIEKYVVLPSKKMEDLNTTTDWMGRNWKHLTYTHPVRSVILMIPFIGNLIIGIYDFINRENNDKESVLKAIKRDETKLEYPFIYGYDGALKFATTWLKDDKDVVLAAVNTFPEALKYASPRLKNDPEVVRAAVNKNGRTLEFASPEFRNDYHMVLAAVNQNGCAIQYANARLQSNFEIARAAVTQHPHAFIYLVADLQEDRQVVLAAVTKNGSVLQFVHYSFQNDEEVVLAALSNGSGYALKYASPRLQDIEEIVLAAATHGHNILEFASRRLLLDRTFLGNVLKINPYAQNYINQLDREYINRILAERSNDRC